MTKNFKSTDPGIPYFVTFTVVEWLNVFTKPKYMQILWDSLQYCRKEKGLKLYGFVFMTNHLHLIISADVENNETPRRKQRGILLDYNFFFVASDGEFNP